MNDKHRAEALGVGLLGLGALLVLAILPPILRGGVTDPNLIGPAGSLLYSGLAFLFGGTSILVSVPAFTWGMERLGVIGRETAIRWSVFIGGALLFLPSAWWMVGSALDRESVGAGWLGMQLGGLLVSVFGTIGAALIVGSILLALTVLAFGWSPAESAGSAARGVNRGMGALGRGAVVTAAKIREVVPSMMARDPDSDSPWERTSVAEETSEAVPEDEPPAGSPSETGKKPTKRKKTKKAEVAESATVDGTDLSDPGDPSRTELPPLDLLTLPGGRGHGIAKSELERLGAILIEKLATFRVDGRIGGWTTGPVVTQFEVVPAAGVKVGQIAALADDLALAMKAPSVRIVAPIRTPRMMTPSGARPVRYAAVTPWLAHGWRPSRDNGRRRAGNRRYYGRGLGLSSGNRGWTDRSRGCLRRHPVFRVRSSRTCGITLDPGHERTLGNARNPLLLRAIWALVAAAPASGHTHLAGPCSSRNGTQRCEKTQSGHTGHYPPGLTGPFSEYHRYHPLVF